MTASRHHCFLVGGPRRGSTKEPAAVTVNLAANGVGRASPDAPRRRAAELARRHPLRDRPFLLSGISRFTPGCPRRGLHAGVGVGIFELGMALGASAAVCCARCPCGDLISLLFASAGALRQRRRAVLVVRNAHAATETLVGAGGPDGGDGVGEACHHPAVVPRLLLLLLLLQERGAISRLVAWNRKDRTWNCSDLLEVEGLSPAAAAGRRAFPWRRGRF